MSRRSALEGVAAGVLPLVVQSRCFMIDSIISPQLIGFEARPRTLAVASRRFVRLLFSEDFFTVFFFFFEAVDARLLLDN